MSSLFVSCRRTDASKGFPTIRYRANQEFCFFWVNCNGIPWSFPITWTGVNCISCTTCFREVCQLNLGLDLFASYLMNTNWTSASLPWEMAFFWEMASIRDPPTGIFSKGLQGGTNVSFSQVRCTFLGVILRFGIIEVGHPGAGLGGDSEVGTHFQDSSRRGADCATSRDTFWMGNRRFLDDTT